jgi:hypothetical protein
MINLPRPVIADNDILLSSAIVEGAAFESPGGLEELREHREEIGELRHTDTTAFTDKAGVDGFMPGGEDTLEVPLTVEPSIYRDYYDTLVCSHLSISYKTVSYASS